LPPIEFTISIRRTLSRDITDDEEDKENIPSSSDKHEVPRSVDACDLSHGGKEEMVETPKITRWRIGGGRVRGAGGRILDSRHMEAQRCAQLDMPSKATTTIQMLKGR
jgi:hypothetical protein